MSLGQTVGRLWRSCNCKSFLISPQGLLNFERQREKSRRKGLQARIIINHYTHSRFLLFETCLLVTGYLKTPHMLQACSPSPTPKKRPSTAPEYRKHHPACVPTQDQATISPSDLRYFRSYSRRRLASRCSTVDFLASTAAASISSSCARVGS